MLDKNTACVFQFKQILDGPVTIAPAEWLRKVVISNDDIGWNQIDDGRIAATKHDVFAGGLEVIINDRQRSGTVPHKDRLCVLSLALEI